MLDHRMIDSLCVSEREQRIDGRDPTIDRVVDGELNGTCTCFDE